MAEHLNMSIAARVKCNCEKLTNMSKNHIFISFSIVILSVTDLILVLGTNK